MITLDDVQRARVQISPCVKRTALERNTTLSSELGTNIHPKLELFQKTGSFKPRGAFAQGMAYASRELGTPVLVCMPESTPRNGVEATRAYGATIDLASSFPQVFARADQYKQQV